MSNGTKKAGPKSTYHFVAGLGSGVLSAVLLQPVDLLKTRVQQSGHHSLRKALTEIRDAPSLIPALWRGTVPSALRTGFGSAVYFTGLNALRQHAAHVPFLAAPGLPAVLTESGIVSKGGGSEGALATSKQGQQLSSSSLPRLSNTGNLLTGASARAFAGFLLMPLTVLKVRFESTLYNSYGSLAAAAGDIARTSGLRGFFAGFGATAVRDAPYAGLYVLFYEQSKRHLGRLFGGNGRASTSNSSSSSSSPTMMGVERAALVNFSSGILAGAACSAISNPFDAVKTRIQLQPTEYRNTWRAAQRMLLEEGPRSFLDGLGLRMTRKALSSALAWTVYEELVRRAESSPWLGRGKNRRSDDVL